MILKVFLQVLPLMYFVNAESDNPPSGGEEVYDYVVVGAGPAGSMVATELAKEGYSTLLMDAGKDVINYNITTPGLMLRTWDDPAIAWDYRVNYYNENSTMRKNVRYLRSSGLGGSTLHDGMVHVYPKQQDFDDIVWLTGDQSWSEATFRKYYESILEGSNSKRSFLPLSTPSLKNNVSFDKKYIGLTALMAKALANKARGYDPNGYTYAPSLLNPIPKRKLAVDEESQFFIPNNIKAVNGRNQKYGVREYVKIVMGQTPKLRFRGDALVTKVILDGNKATGVEYMSGEHLYRASPLADKSNATPIKTFKIRARKEVIISGGVFNSPQILNLSGIGDKDYLKSHGINSTVHLPGVGKNLQDHYEIPVNFELDSEWEMIKRCKFTSEDSDECWRKYLKGDGPYNLVGYLFAQTLKSDANPKDTDLMQYSGGNRWLGYTDTMSHDATRFRNYISIITQLGHINSRKGTVTLKSNDPRDTPNINFNYFQDGGDKDIRKMIFGIKSARKQVKITGWKMTETEPGKHVQSDAELEKYVRERTFGHHACCTNKIGRDNDPEAVLDKDFKVRGVENLRVIDQSSIPAIWGNFPVLSTYMLGIKGAEAIIKDHR